MSVGCEERHFQFGHTEAGGRPGHGHTHCSSCAAREAEGTWAVSGRRGDLIFMRFCRDFFHSLKNFLLF